jgi:hypothetical protein
MKIEGGVTMVMMISTGVVLRREAVAALVDAFVVAGYAVSASRR